MRLHRWLAGVLLVMPVLALAAETNAVRIGVYDSRSIAVAFAGTPGFKADLERLKKDHEQALARGDRKRAAELAAEGEAWQRRMHQQGFGTAPVTEMLRSIAGQMPGIASNANVSAFVSVWDTNTLARYPAAQRVDVTMALVDALHPNAQQRKWAIEAQKHPPVAQKELDCMDVRE